MAEERTMQPAPEKVKLTYEDLLALPDDGMRHELIDGEHDVSPSPGAAHQIIAGNFHFRIRAYLQDHPIGVLLFAPFDIVLSRFDVVVPDLIYFCSERFKGIVDERNAQGPPDLAIEILSPSTRRRDEIVKRKLYERTGFGEYWIADPDLETVKVHRMIEGRYQRVAELSLEGESILTSPLFPSLELPLAELFKLP